MNRMLRWFVVGLLPSPLGIGILIIHNAVPRFRGIFWWEHLTVLAGFIVCLIAGRKLAGPDVDTRQIWDPNIDRLRWRGLWLGIGLFVLNAAIVCGGCTLAVIYSLRSL